MKSCVVWESLIIILSIAHVSAANATDPQILSSTPAKLIVVEGRADTFPISIQGNHFLASDTTGYNVSDHVKVLFRDDTRNWMPLKITGWLDSRITVGLDTKDALYRTNTLYFKVVTKGVSSNILTVPVVAVPAQPPHLNPLNQTILIGKDEGFRYLIRLSGTNFSNEMTVRINGTECYAGNPDPSGGSCYSWLPVALRQKPGRYGIVVATKRGTSNALYVDVVSPKLPLVTHVAPAKFWTNPTATADVMVTMTYEGARPTQAQVCHTSTRQLNWRTAKMVDIGFGKVQVTVPADLLHREHKVRVKLTNAYGISTGDVAIIENATVVSGLTTPLALRLATPKLPIPAPTAPRISVQ